MEQPIATLSLLGRLDQTQDEFPVTVSIGTPYTQANGSWACPVDLKGLHDRLPDMVGEDSLQALCLAIQLAGKLLAAFVGRGGRLRSPNDDPEDCFPLEAYFGYPESPPAGGAA